MYVFFQPQLNIGTIASSSVIHSSYMPFLVPNLAEARTSPWPICSRLGTRPLLAMQKHKFVNVRICKDKDIDIDNKHRCMCMYVYIVYT